MTNLFAIVEFENVSGQLYRSDQDLFQEWKTVYCSGHRMLASDDEIMNECVRKNKQGVEYYSNYLVASQAFMRRYIRTVRKCKDGVRRSCFIVLDHDVPFGHGDWLGKTENPQFVVINPVSAKAHIVFVLDRMYDVDGPEYKATSEYLRGAIGAERANPPSFRSPFFKTNGRKHSENFRKGKREADCHYVIHHDVGPYSLFYLNPSRPFDIGETEAIETTPKKRKPGKNPRLFDTVREFAYSFGSSVSFGELYRFAEYNNVENIAPESLRSVSRSVLKFMRTKFNASYSPEELSERGFFGASVRWRRHHEILGDAARRFGVSLRTINYWKSSGKIILVKGFWVKPSNTYTPDIGIVQSSAASVTHGTTPRNVYGSNAERQKAYRERKEERLLKARQNVSQRPPQETSKPEEPENTIQATNLIPEPPEVLAEPVLIPSLLPAGKPFLVATSVEKEIHTAYLFSSSDKETREQTYNIIKMYCGNRCEEDLLSTVERHCKKQSLMYLAA